MSSLNLVLYPDDPLTQVAEPVTDFGPDLTRLAQDMLELMYESQGVGLAGPQVGLAKRIIVLHEPDGAPMCLINPDIVDFEGLVEGEEGCLSIPNIYAMVPRATRIRVRAQDTEGVPLDFEARDFLARIIQHETDHLDGRVFIDRVDILARQALLQEWEQARESLSTPSNPS